MSMRLQLLGLLVLRHALAWTCATVSVGDGDTSVRMLLDAGCSNATTLVLLNATSTVSSSSTTTINTRAQIITGGSCEAAVVSATQVPSKTAANTRVLELDVRKRGIQRVMGIPSGVQVLQLDDNAVETLQPGQGGGNATTSISLVNNSIASLATFAFPASLLTLDLTANALESISSASFPSKLTMLNLTRNPIASLEFARLPPKLQHLNVAGARLQTLEHLSLPNSLLSLNVSGNPITRIAGVRFPAALQRLVISSKAQIALASSMTSSKTTAAAIAAATSANESTAAATALAEFEVRRTDAERFRKLQLFHVAATSTRSCSDARAKFFVVNDTVLCVLSDDDFATKYAHVTAATAASSDGDDNDASSLLTRTNATRANRMRERLRLHETWHQRRSWFLLVSASLLGGFVAAIGISGCCRACARRAGARSRRRGRDSAAIGSTRKAPVSATKSALTTETETELQLGGSTDKSERCASALSTSSTSSALQPLRRSMLSSPPRRLAGIALPGPAKSALSSQDDEAVQVTYALASLHDQVVMLKTLHVQRKRQRSDSHATGSYDRSRSPALRRFMAEIRLHATLSHPHLVRFIGYLHEPFDGLNPKRLRVDTDDCVETLTLVTEFMPNRTLDDVVATQRARALDALASQRSDRGPLLTQQQQEQLGDHDAASPREASLDPPEATYDAWSWPHDSPTLPSKLSVAIATARVLAYLHAFEPSLVHGNLSARKVLLDRSWRVQLSDLSCCSALQRWSERQLSRAQSASPSPRSSGPDSVIDAGCDDHDSVQMDMTVWTAPEVIDGQQYTPKADMYSFGILLAYLDTYEFPVDLLHRVDSDVAILSTSDVNSKMVPMIGSARAPAPIRMLVLQCLSFQPEDRPSARDALDELLALQLDLHDIASSSEAID